MTCLTSLSEKRILSFHFRTQHERSWYYCQHIAVIEVSPRLRDLTGWEKEECQLCLLGFLNLQIVCRMKFSRLILHLPRVLRFVSVEVRLVGFRKGLVQSPHYYQRGNETKMKNPANLISERVLGLTPSHAHYSQILLFFITCLACSRAEQCSS